MDRMSQGSSTNQDMAPFSRGRGGFRGRGSQRGRGRGRGGFATRGRKSSKFHDTRVDQTADSASDVSSASDAGEEEGIEDVDEDATSEEDEVNKPTMRPYNVLLQSLKPDLPHGPPHRKKRKIERDNSLRRGLEGAPVAEVIAEPEEGVIDAIEELEEPPSPIADGSGDEAENDGFEDASDPFDMHFTNPNEKDLKRKLQAISDNQRQTERAQVPELGKSMTLIPGIGQATISVPSGHGISGPQNLKLKKKLSEPANRLLPRFSQLEAILASHIFNYRDLLFPAKSVVNAESLRRLTCLHALNHVLKTRDRVIKNNARLAKASQDGDIELRDQGFTRPKVLMLLPTRQACVKAVETITALCEPEQQENKKRFQETYSHAEEKFSEDKPEDFKELFGGNDDDMFRLGLKLTRKTFKFFAQFSSSDIIFASPLGLRMAIGAESSKKEDYDFLSSIELIIVDQADALLMQNWEHVEYIFQHLNLQPKEARGCDFGRVRHWYLDGNAKFLRQTIVISAFNTPEINNLFTSHMHNVAGKTRFLKNYDGAMIDLGVEIKQTFSRYESSSVISDPDKRFKYFTTAVVPSLTRHVRSSSDRGQGILIFIPSYLDFVRVRNYFSDSPATQHISFGSISEYTSVREVARARSHFFSGRHAVLLYTERAHHFRRYHIRGVKKVVMYGLPDNPIFYREIIGGYLAASIGEGQVMGGEAGVRAIFSKWDALKLERIVGTKRVSSMLQEKGGDTFDFI